MTRYNKTQLQRRRHRRKVDENARHAAKPRGVEKKTLVRAAIAAKWQARSESYA